LGRQGKEVKSNVTDNESANMMTSHGTIQGYNGQALVDSKHQVIVHAEAFGEGQDHYHIAPMMEGAKGNMEALGYEEDYFEGKKLVADSSLPTEAVYQDQVLSSWLSGYSTTHGTYSAWFFRT
jgi:hypothetical protein